MALGFGVLPIAGHFDRPREPGSRRIGSDGLRWPADDEPDLAQAGGDARPLSRPRPRLLGLGPGWRGGSAKWAGPK